MNATTTQYPEPIRSDINAPMLDAWAKGELQLQQCQDCAHKVYFPRTQCPHCWSTKLEWKRLSGQGKVVSFAKVHKHVHASFAQESPVILAEILLDEGWSMLARLLATDSDGVDNGMLVELVSGDAADRFPLPTFRPQK